MKTKIFAFLGTAIAAILLFGTAHVSSAEGREPSTLIVSEREVEATVTAGAALDQFINERNARLATEKLRVITSQYRMCKRLIENIERAYAWNKLSNSREYIVTLGAAINTYKMIGGWDTCGRTISSILEGEEDAK